MMRTVFVSAKAANPQLAENFVRHLLRVQAASDPLIFPLPPLAGSNGNDAQRTIDLDPALMTYLDKMKREAFIREWEDAIVQDE